MADSNVRKTKKTKTMSAQQKAKVARKTSTTALRVVLGILVLVVVFLATYYFSLKAYDFGKVVFTENGVEEEPGEDVTITVPRGATTKEIATILKENGLIESVYAFMLQTFLYEGEYYAGTFELNTSMSPEDIIETLSTQTSE